jgi:hypothetical protein
MMPQPPDGNDQTGEVATGEPNASWPGWLPRRLLTIADLAEIF